MEAKIDYHGFYWVTEVGFDLHYTTELKGANNMVRLSASHLLPSAQEWADNLRADNYKTATIILDFNESLMTNSAARDAYLKAIKKNLAQDSDLIKMVAFLDISEEQWTLLGQGKFNDWKVFQNPDGSPGDYYENTLKLKKGLEDYITDIKKYFPNIPTKIVENYWGYTHVPPDNLDVLGIDEYIIPDSPDCDPNFTFKLFTVDWAKPYGKPIYLVGPVFDDTHFRMLSACQAQWYIDFAKNTPEVIGLDWFLYPDFPDIHMQGARNHGPIAYLKQQGQQLVAAAHPTLPSYNLMPKGNLDGINANGMIYGWGYDRDNTGGNITANFYISDVGSSSVGPTGATGTFVGSTVTNKLRPDVNSAFSITGTHGFEFPVPAQYRDNQDYLVSVLAIDSDDSRGYSNAFIGSKIFRLSSTPSSILGDLNHDGTVNSIDWSIMNSVWFTNNADADLNYDGVVNSIDFSIMNQNWFKTSI